jgi:hypothetical protein
VLPFWCAQRLAARDCSMRNTPRLVCPSCFGLQHACSKATAHIPPRHDRIAHPSGVIVQAMCVGILVVGAEMLLIAMREVEELRRLRELAHRHVRVVRIASCTAAAAAELNSEPLSHAMVSGQLEDGGAR